MQQAQKCPVCKQDWPGDKFVGERAIAASNRRQSRTAPQSSAPVSTQRRSKDGMDDEDDSEEEE